MQKPTPPLNHWISIIKCQEILIEIRSGHKHSPRIQRTYRQRLLLKWDCLICLRFPNSKTRQFQHKKTSHFRYLNNGTVFLSGLFASFLKLTWSSQSCVLFDNFFYVFRTNQVILQKRKKRSNVSDREWEENDVIHEESYDEGQFSSCNWSIWKMKKKKTTWKYVARWWITMPKATAPMTTKRIQQCTRQSHCDDFPLYV